MIESKKKKKYNCVVCKKKNEDQSQFIQFRFSESTSKSKVKILKSKGYKIGDIFFLCEECKNVTPKDLLKIWQENIKKYDKEWLSEEEIKRLWLTPGISSRDLLLLRTCYYGALRISEALNSKKEDYREDDGYTYLLLRKQKTDKKNWAVQIIPPHIYGEIFRYCDDKNIISQDFIFQSNRSPQLSYPMAYKIVKACMKLANIKKPITTHSFRRSRATHLLNNGMSLEDVSLMLRHEDLGTTMKYLKISKRILFEKMNKVDKKILFDKIVN